MNCMVDREVKASQGMYSRTVCSRDGDRAELSALVDNRNTTTIHFRYLTIGEKDIGYEVRIDFSKHHFIESSS